MGERWSDTNTGGRRARQIVHAHWCVFLPTVAIALLYGSVWVWSMQAGHSNNGLARLSLLVLAVGVPLLFVHAGLRYVTTRISVGETAIRLRSGFVRREPRTLRLRDLAGVSVRRGIVGRVLDTGTVVFFKRNGDREVVLDVADPDAVGRAIFQLS